MAWTRADKINTLIACTALVTALAPPGRSLWVYEHRPVAAIDHPDDESRSAGPTVAVDGTAERIPSDSDLWLVIRSDGRWYPVERCQPGRNGRWSFRDDDVHLGGPKEKGLYVLSVYLAGPSQTGEFAQFVNGQQQSKDSGLASLPDGIKLLATRTVNRVS